MNWYKKAQSYQEIIDNPEDYMMDDDPESLNAYLYFSIGQNEETYEDSFCWIFDGRKLHVKKKGTHYQNFPELHFQTRNAPNAYRGWYDPIQKMISVVAPRQSVNGQWDKALEPSSLPTKLRVSLGDTFGTDNQIKVF
jgi:hypothetical protein